MSDVPVQEQKEVKQVKREETRNFVYSKEGSTTEFGFDIDVSTPKIALVEIADFKELLLRAGEDLTKLSKVFSDKLEKEEKPEENKKTSSNTNIQTAT